MERTIEATIDLHATPDRAAAVLIDDPTTVLADGPVSLLEDALCPEIHCG